MAAPVTDTALDAHYIVVQKYYMLASVALLLHDLVTTLDVEVARVWSGKFSPFVILWALNRWFPALGYIFVVWLAHSTSISANRCKKLVTIVPSMQMISYGVITLIVILRTWAIYGGRLWPVVLLASVYVVALTVQTYVVATSVTSVDMPPGVNGCLLGATPESGLRFLFFWIVALVFDTLLFGLTFFKGLSLQAHGLRFPLISLLMRDGIIYFFFMFLANVMNVILFVTAPPQLKGMNAYFSHITTVIMISHLMLNLRTHTQRGGVVTSGNLAKSPVGSRSAGLTTMMTTLLTPNTPSPSSGYPRSMVTETMERFGARMEGDPKEYEEITDLPIAMYSWGHPRSS